MIKLKHFSCGLVLFVFLYIFSASNLLLLLLLFLPLPLYMHIRYFEFLFLFCCTFHLQFVIPLLCWMATHRFVLNLLFYRFYYLLIFVCIYYFYFYCRFRLPGSIMLMPHLFRCILLCFILFCTLTLISLVTYTLIKVLLKNTPFDFWRQDCA